MTENYFNSEIINNELKIESNHFFILKSLAGWTRFLSITAFIILGLSVLFALSMFFLMERINMYNPMYMTGSISWLHYIGFLLILIVYFIPVYYLFKFSSKLKVAINNYNSNALSDALGFLNKHYVYVGVLTIIALVIYFLSFIGLFWTMYIA